jgi:hypothetical protein
MSIENQHQLRGAKAKLRELEELYTNKQNESPSRVRELTLLSLKKRINQFTEEIARFESRSRTTAQEI